MAMIAERTRAPADATPSERAALGKAARARSPRSGHGEWEPASDRPDPLNSDRFDQGIARFTTAYADQNERDYAALQAAVEDGRLAIGPEPT